MITDSASPEGVVREYSEYDVSRGFSENEISMAQNVFAERASHPYLPEFQIQEILATRNLSYSTRGTTTFNDMRFQRVVDCLLSEFHESEKFMAQNVFAERASPPRFLRSKIEKS